jgi:glycine reductase
LEKAGIPVVQIASVTDAAMLVGVSRLIRGYRLICPASDFTLDPESEKESRRRFVRKAMEMLKEPGQKNHFETVGMVDAN